MRRVLAITIVSVASVLLLFITTMLLQRIHKLKRLAREYETFPGFVLSDINGEIFRSEEVSQGPLLLVYFHPGCEHCSNELLSLLQVPDRFKQVRTILVSYAGNEELREFFTHENFNSGNPTVLSDTSLTLWRILDVRALPSNYIFNSELKLVRVIRGEATTGTLLKYLTGES